ncbi:hypothetical protein G9A89_016898 [Geosiphon pyriformis]|nr:hypothetical protein G9A89_016898 [Geosiphon pyriformis]
MRKTNPLSIILELERRDNSISVKDTQITKLLKDLETTREQIEVTKKEIKNISRISQDPWSGLKSNVGRRRAYISVPPHMKQTKLEILLETMFGQVQEIEWINHFQDHGFVTFVNTKSYEAAITCSELSIPEGYIAFQEVRNPLRGKVL